MKPAVLTDPDIFRLLRDILMAEIRMRRNSGADLPDVTPETDLADSRWGLDSIEFMGIAGCVNEMFHLYKTGIEDNLLRFKTLDQWIRVVSVSWQEHPEELTFRTSGSTGEPRAWVHGMDTLIQEVNELSRSFSDRKRIISLVPSHHIYGFLFTVLLPRMMGIEVLDGRFAGPGKLRETLISGDLVISFPLNWAYLEQSLPRWPNGVQGVTSTGPVQPALIRRLLDRGIERMTEVYGSSEDAGIGLRHHTDDPYTLFSYWRRADEQEDRLIRTLPAGGEKQTRPADILEWDGPASFRLAGRRDGAVQVAGINVYPERTARKILEHPLVKDCAVRLAEEMNPPRLKAFIVPDPAADPKTIRPKMEKWLLETFPAPERPVYLTFGTVLPQNPMGKLADWNAEKNP
jgi:4-coumarate--CoA ligase